LACDIPLYSLRPSKNTLYRQTQLSISKHISVFPYSSYYVHVSTYLSHQQANLHKILQFKNARITTYLVVKNNGYFTCRPIYIYDAISLSSS
jgi:hypothetical protein